MTEFKKKEEYSQDSRIFFNKIKVKGVDVDLSYSQVKGEDIISSTLKKSDDPLESFKEAIQALKPEVITLAELPEEWSKDIVVLGMTLKYGDLQNGNQLKGFTISATRYLETSNSPMNFATPYKEFPNIEDEENELSEVLAAVQEKINVIIVEAEKYLNGQRAARQLKLGEEETEE